MCSPTVSWLPARAAGGGTGALCLLEGFWDFQELTLLSQGQRWGESAAVSQPARWLKVEGDLKALSRAAVTDSSALSSPLPPRRAILVLKDSVVPMSCEFTPETERQRIQHLVSDSSHASNNPAASIPLGQRGLEPGAALAFPEGHCMASTSPGTSQGGLATRFNQQEMFMSFLGCAFPVVFAILLLGVPVSVSYSTEAEPGHAHTCLPSPRLFFSPSSWMVSSHASSFHGG